MPGSVDRQGMIYAINNATMIEIIRRAAVLAGTGLALLLLPAGCSDPVGVGDRPNVLFVVWDTVRADRMSLYGHDNPTTPFLDEWAKGARVFENCTSTGSSTVPSHGSMFTGLFPSEHGANTEYNHLADRHKTLAEIFREGGYRTYLYSENPHISEHENFHQGFDQEEHPWDPAFRPRAMRLLQRTFDPRDQSSELAEYIKEKKVSRWLIKGAGKLAQQGLMRWVKEGDPSRPFFVFLNYMEAHRPYVPNEEYRKRLLTPGQIEVSFRTDFSLNRIWSYSLGLHEYTPEELEATGLVYDACIAALDGLFKNLIKGLEKNGLLENTVVVLTSDHGEHLGEHHMLGHQFFLHEELVRVPLIVYFPGKVDAGRVKEPVVNYDIFPTLLELAGLKEPPGLRTRAVSLLDPERKRLRMAEYPADYDFVIKAVKPPHPDWDTSHFRRKLVALYDGDLKYVEASNGGHELYNLAADPGEERNLFHGDEKIRDGMADLLAKYREGLELFDYEKAAKPLLSSDQLERLKALGYGTGK